MDSVQQVQISCHWQSETFYGQPSANAMVKFVFLFLLCMNMALKLYVFL